MSTRRENNCTEHYIEHYIQNFYSIILLHVGNKSKDWWIADPLLKI